jgi:hypothetical protein
MKYIDKMLATDERVVRVSHDHWIALLPAILIDGIVSVAIVALAVVAMGLSGPLPALALLLILIPLGHLLWRIWVWWSKQYVITNRRIIQISGMLNKRVSDTLLEKINDIVTEQSAMGRLFGFGDLEIIAGSESGIDVFYRLADPVGFKRGILDQQVPGGSVPVESSDEEGIDSVPELIAELDELRKKGLLTDAEFEEKKRKLLDRI